MASYSSWRATYISPAVAAIRVPAAPSQCGKVANRISSLCVLRRWGRGEEQLHMRRRVFVIVARLRKHAVQVFSFRL